MNTISSFTFCLSDWSFRHRPRCWPEHAAVCINSLRANTSLHPICYWHGEMKSPIVRVLRGFGVEVIPSDRRFDFLADGKVAVDGWHPEIFRALMQKIEAVERSEEEFLIVGDVDTLWLRQPEWFDFETAIAAGPAANVGDKFFNAGMMVINRAKFIEKSEEILRIAEREVGHRWYEQLILDTAFPAWTRLPAAWEHRPWWPLPARTPAVIHFHGPKLHQFRDLMAKRPEKISRTAELFYENQGRCLAIGELSEPYRISPLALLESINRAMTPR